MHEVITIGAGTRDVFLISDQFKFIQSSAFETGVGECVALGTKIDVDRIVHTTGGGATNAAVTFARLGYKTATVCRVGDDAAGRDLIIDLHRENVDTTLIQRVANGETGYSTLLTATTGERTVLVYRGVSATFRDQDIPIDQCQAKVIYVTSLAGNLALVRKIAQYAKRCRGIMAWNPGRAEIAKGLTRIAPILPHVRVFTLNREEAENLTKKKQIADLFRGLATPGNTVIITDGANGAYAHQDGKTWFAATRNIPPVSQTGAGDAFGSGFVASYAKKPDLKAALAVGTLNAESVIQQVGAKAGIMNKWPPAALVKKIRIKSVH